MTDGAPRASSSATAVELEPGITNLAGASDRRQDIGYRLRREIRGNRMATLGVVYLVFIVLVAVVGPSLVGDPRSQNLIQRLQPPSLEHPLGTDQYGRDVLTRMVHGARVSLFVGLAGALGGVVLGTLVGLVTGYWAGSWIDQLGMRIVDIMYAFPGILLAILIAAILGASMVNLIIALSIWGIPTLSRIVRGVVLSLREQEYVLAARAVGASAGRIMARHLVVNAVGPIIVYATLSVASAILTAAGLGFLGLGVPPPTPEWGAMLSEARDFVFRAPYLSYFPGAAIFLTVLAVNFVGDALRDAFDPRSEVRRMT
jgi:peptide/nickel transport system permease protein